MAEHPDYLLEASRHVLDLRERLTEAEFKLACQSAEIEQASDRIYRLEYQVKALGGTIETDEEENLRRIDELTDELKASLARKEGPNG